MKTFAVATAAVALLTSAGPAWADTVVALTADNGLVTIDTAAATASAPTGVTGIDGRLLGIDWRPSDRKLYGLFADGIVATIDPATGIATRVDTLKMVPPDGQAVTVDFNPAADALRIMGSDGTNLRTKLAAGAVTEDGRHAFAAADMHAGETPMVVAGAYTNAFDGAEATSLYTIDGTIGSLLKQDPPNDGVLAAVGKLGITLDATIGFDIKSGGPDMNEAWLLSGGKLYAVDLATGAATEAGTITGLDGAVRDIAILPGL
jgi:DNA-binding beta-propeller fold protein YncE